MKVSPINLRSRSCKASVLVGVLWCLALLAVVVVGVLHTSRMDLQIVKSYGDRIQAHYLALAGVERAKALIYQDMLDRRRRGKNHTGALYNSTSSFQDVPFGRGHFQIIRSSSPNESEGLVYGISDEESRLNVNVATVEELMNLKDMTPNIAAAIVSWRAKINDQNSDISGGADAEYYSSLRPPYRPRGGPFQTVRELLMVRGVTPELLLGGDIKQTGRIDGGDDSSPARGSAASQPPGWAEFLCVDSSVANVSAAGTDRVNIQTADESALAAVNGITPEIAKAIVAYRSKNQNQLQTLAGLLEVTPAPKNQNQGQNANTDNSKVISPELLQQIADDLTTTADYDLPGLVNINTASREALACLPGITPELAQAIVGYRQSNVYFENVACLLQVPGIDPQILKQVLPRITARSETFRILAEGQVASTKARQRIQVIVHLVPHDVKTLAYREDL